MDKQTMNLTKIYVSKNSITYAPAYNPVSQVRSDLIILVPDEESYHLIKGMEFIYNKVWKVQLLEPGTPKVWVGMYSPYHLNTDSYRLQFIDHILMYKERV